MVCYIIIVLRMRLVMQLLLMRTAVWKCFKISSVHNSPVYLWMKTCYSSRMEQKATQQECQWTQLMLCFRTESFPGMGISHGTPLPRLNPLRLFSLGYLKTKVFETKPRTIADLKQRIQDEVAAIPVEMLREIMNSFMSRLEECLRRNGSHLEGVIFEI